MTTIIDIQALMTPYAEAPCSWCMGSETGLCGTAFEQGCGGTGLDPLYAALRGEHDFDEVAKCYRCGLYERKHLQNEEDDVATTLYCLQTDLGALVRVAAACHLRIEQIEESDGRWIIPLRRILGENEDEIFACEADNPEDSLGQAVVAAVPLEPNA